MSGFVKTLWIIGFVVCLAVTPLPAQKKKKSSDDEGLILPPVAKDKKKKKNENVTQTLPPPLELPLAVVAETDRLAFEVSPLSAKGLLSQQTRDALKVLMRGNHGTVVKLRAFVAGSGDLRRVGEIAAEVFSEKHLPLPVLSVVQVGALPLEGAQVVIESTLVEKRSVNPNGVAFVSGQAGTGLDDALSKLKAVLQTGHLELEDVLRTTCYISSLDTENGVANRLTEAFHSAAVNYVQTQREPVGPAAECEAVARLHDPPAAMAVLGKGERYSQMALVHNPKLVITGTQLAFGSQANDIDLAFGRLQKMLAQFNSSLSATVMSHIYLMSPSMSEKFEADRAKFFSSETPPASTILPFEGLPSLDATLGLDVIAVAQN